MTTLLNSNQSFGRSFPANPRRGRAGENRGVERRGGERSGGGSEQITYIIGMKENCYKKTANVIGKKSIANLSSRFVLSFKLKGH